MKISKHIKLAQGDLATFEAPVSGTKRRFSLVGYTGAAMSAGQLGSVIVDLNGMNPNGNRKPIFRQHDANRIAGYSDTINKSDQLVMSGTITDKTEAGREVMELADDGFPWQASIGIDIQKIQQLKAGDSVEVNGRTFDGPGIVIRQSLLKECSFVPLGADGATSALVFAESEEGDIELDTNTKEPEMDLTIETLKANHPEVFKAARDEGYNEGKAEATAKPATSYDLRAAFSDTGFVLDCLEKNLSLESAKAAFADTLAPKLEAANAEIVALKAKLTEATSGQGAVGFSAPAATVPACNSDNPKDIAAHEWDNQPEVRKGFSCKDNYVYARAAELDGSHKTYAREPVQS